jgi:hypothetical protein
MFTGLGGGYAAGTYRAEWDGSGVVTFGADAVVAKRGTTAAGRAFADLLVTPTDSGISMRIEATSPSDPVRGFNVWMPAWNGRSFVGERWQPSAAFSPFHPLFLERLAAFKTLRFMDLQETNTSDIVTWADRRDAADIRQGSGSEGTPSEPIVNGMSLEYMVQLANDLDADPWFNMPCRADDNFVRNFATYVAGHLEPGRKVYVEWANEVWNFGAAFEASAWIGTQLGRPENAGLDPDLAHWIIAGREAKRDMDIWTSVFATAGTARDLQLVRVAAGQAANVWIVEQITAAMGNSFDAIALAPYITFTDVQRAGYTLATTVDRVLADARTNVATSLQWTTEHADLAARLATRLGRPIGLLAYEGGPHLDGRDAAYQAAFDAATNDPRMGAIYRDYLRGLDAAGLDLYVDYRFTGQAGAGQWGDFAKLHRMDEPVSTAWNSAAVVAAADGSLWSDAPPSPPPFTSLRTIGTVDFGTIAAGYAVRASGAVIPVTWSGRNASASSPGGGWAAVGARRSGAGYEVLWRHAALGLVGTWSIDAAGRQTSARSIGLAAAQALETQVGFDLSGDGIVGVPPVAFTVQRTIGTVEFGTIATGYAVRASGAVVPVTWSGRNASASSPGGGWVAVGARRSGAGYEVLWRHAALGLVGTWSVDAAGRQTSARGLRLAEAKALETQVGFDLTGDGIVGAA